MLPLSSQADTCRAAHQALQRIACARPAATVTALSMEVARYNAQAHAQTIQHVAASSALLRARTEVVKLIELLAEKQANELGELMVPVSSTTQKRRSTYTDSCCCSLPMSLYTASTRR